MFVSYVEFVKISFGLFDSGLIKITSENFLESSKKKQKGKEDKKTFLVLNPPLKKKSSLLLYSNKDAARVRQKNNFLSFKKPNEYKKKTQIKNLRLEPLRLLFRDPIIHEV